MNSRATSGDRNFLPFCDLTRPSTCPGPGQVCLNWYEPGYEPPGLENLGLCGLMQ
jgi:hypothetical protein